MPPLPRSTPINSQEDLEIASSMLQLLKYQHDQEPPTSEPRQQQYHQELRLEKTNQSPNSPEENKSAKKKKTLPSSPSFLLQKQDNADYQTRQSDIPFRFYSNVYANGTIELNRDDHPYPKMVNHFGSDVSVPSSLGTFRNNAGVNDTYRNFLLNQAQGGSQYHHPFVSPNMMMTPSTSQQSYQMMKNRHDPSLSYDIPHFQDKQPLRWETHQRSNGFNFSPMSIHANAGSYSQVHHQGSSPMEGSTIYQFKHTSKESKDHLNFETYYNPHSNKVQKIDTPNKINHTVSEKSPQSSERSDKTFSFQTIYRALNRHLRGKDEEYQKPSKKFLEGVRRGSYISEIRRASIEEGPPGNFSRKRSNEESLESTEISSMTTSSSIQTSYRERKIPSDFVRADSNSLAQSNSDASHVMHNSRSSTKIEYQHITPRYHQPIMLGMATDADHISKFLQFLRAECCEVFTAGQNEVYERRKSKPVIIHQVGIRCAFCAHKPYEERAARSSCYPSCFDRIYQSVVMMVRDHFTICPHFPPEVREEYDLIKTTSRRRRDIDSRQYWAISAKSLGISETEMGLFFK